MVFGWKEMDGRNFYKLFLFSSIWKDGKGIEGGKIPPDSILTPLQY